MQPSKDETAHIIYLSNRQLVTCGKTCGTNLDPSALFVFVSNRAVGSTPFGQKIFAIEAAFGQKCRLICTKLCGFFIADPIK
jgi:hypothetical protein